MRSSGTLRGFPMGRAAQPLHEATRSHCREFYSAFAGYRNLQGLFVERCTCLLRVSGRMGLVIPSSMSEQEGYGPTRLAHDRRCVCDNDLPDFGEDAFVGVFQPCMLLRSTKRSKEITLEEAERWPIERPDLDLAAPRAAREDGPASPAGRTLRRARPSVVWRRYRPSPERAGPAARGRDARRRRHRALPAGDRPRSSLRGPRVVWGGGCARRGSGPKVRVVLIRQTARFPMAVLSDGVGFRNSILAGFATKEYPAEFLVAYLNSTPIRWLHYFRNRDARQGMPQMKIGALEGHPGTAFRATGSCARRTRACLPQRGIPASLRLSRRGSTRWLAKRST